MLLDAILVAAALYVCPGDVYSDQPRAGCHPMQDSNKEGVNQIPEARNLIRNRRIPQRSMPEERRETRNPVFRLRQPRNMRCTRNGSSCPPSRAASEPVISHQESSNGGQT